ADDPCQFLAACFAWADYEADRKSLCHVPVYLDGSCSGLQHWAALLSDRKTAEAVNLLPSKRPRDLYQEVADEGMTLLAERAGAKWESNWHAWKFDRKIVKPAVMVLPYGGTDWSQPKRILEAVRNQLQKEKRSGFWRDYREEWEAVRFLSHVVSEAMSRFVEK